MNNIKRKLNNSYQNKLVKNRLSLRDIIDALLINDFSNIIEITEENQNTEINNIINECLDELANIPIIEEETQKILKNIYSEIKHNSFQIEAEKIFTSLINDRKYKNYIEKIKFNTDNNIIINNIQLYKDLIQSLIQSGGFDEKNANKIIKIIKEYLYNSKEINSIEEKMRKLNNNVKEESELIIVLDQLKKIKNSIQEIHETLQNYNGNYEMKEMFKIKNNFEKNNNIYINNSQDPNFIQALNQVKDFVKGKDIETILESMRDIIKDVESNFYVDESLDLVSYCWGIQNGHEFIVDL